MRIYPGGWGINPAFSQGPGRAVQLKIKNEKLKKLLAIRSRSLSRFKGSNTQHPSTNSLRQASASRAGPASRHAKLQREQRRKSCTKRVSHPVPSTQLSSPQHPAIQHPASRTLPPLRSGRQASHPSPSTQSPASSLLPPLRSGRLASHPASICLVSGTLFLFFFKKKEAKKTALGDNGGIRHSDALKLTMALRILIIISYTLQAPASFAFGRACYAVFFFPIVSKARPFVKCPASSIQHPVSSIQHPVPSPQHPAIPLSALLFGLSLQAYDSTYRSIWTPGS